LNLELLWADAPIAASLVVSIVPQMLRNFYGAIERRAKEIDYPVEAVLEMAIAGFLDGESLSFMDCKPRY
jgi:hypothetical protein